MEKIVSFNRFFVVARGLKWEEILVEEVVRGNDAFVGIPLYG